MVFYFNGMLQKFNLHPNSNEFGSTAAYYPDPRFGPFTVSATWWQCVLHRVAQHDPGPIHLCTRIRGNDTRSWQFWQPLLCESSSTYFKIIRYSRLMMQIPKTVSPKSWVLISAICLCPIFITSYPVLIWTSGLSMAYHSAHNTSSMSLKELHLCLETWIKTLSPDEQLQPSHMRLTRILFPMKLAIPMWDKW